jgi:hypothetical protein
MNSIKIFCEGAGDKLSNKGKFIVIGLIALIPLFIYKAILQAPVRDIVKIERCEALVKKTEKPRYSDERSDCVEYLAARKRGQK